jgi:Ca2+-binding EF-hand superfamily protein
MKNSTAHWIKTVSPKHRLRVTLLLPLFCLVSVVFAQPSAGKKKERIGGHTPRQVLNLFGYRGILGITDQQVAGYRRVFGFGDANRDGRHSKKEYIEDGFYLTKQSRQGIFRASDSDGDGFVTEAEYVINRMITDEAKEIFHKLDANKDNKLSAKEIIASGKFKDEKLAQAVFKTLDVDGNKSLIIPEYLRVWGRWARAD